MSAAIVEKKSVKMMFCASCGIAESDDIKLKKCNGCYLVKYCSVKCQKEHRKKHKKECKKRAAELRDEILFKQPESNHYGNCPICCLPLSLDPKKSTSYSCCSKYLCIGCDYANKMRETEGKLRQKCPFCREALPNTEEEWDEQLMKRIEANDPVAICYMGTERYDQGDYRSALDYWTRAVALGDVVANHQLSVLYRDGQGVEKDEKKELHHAEQAAIGGHPYARHSLGNMELKDCRVDRAVKHFIIAAKLGYDDSVSVIKQLYQTGLVSKEDFAIALRGHKAAIDATKSPQREEAEKWKAERKREEAS